MENKALYLVGDEDINDPESSLLYLDPHFLRKSQPSSDSNSLENFMNECMCTSVRTFDPKDMCNSLAPGFYIRDINDYKDWVINLKSMKDKFADSCIFSIAE